MTPEARPIDGPSNDDDRDALRRRLIAATETLLDSNTFPYERLQAAHAIAGLLAEPSGVDVNDRRVPDSRHVNLPDGLAIAPLAAARCVLDFERTARFLQGIEAGIREAQRRFPGERIEVLYAGCGPYALLALPLCARFSPDEVCFTLLEVHARSLEAARATTARLGYEPYIRAYHECDATTYRHSAERPPQMVVAEVMQQGMMNEPQLKVMANLAPQMIDGGIFIPERIIVDLGIATVGGEGSGPQRGEDAMDGTSDRPLDYIAVARLLDLSAGSAGELIGSADIDPLSGHPSLPPLIVELPPAPAGAASLPALLTHVTIFDSITLERNMSGLTVPKSLHQLGPLSGGERIELRYLLGSSPRFVGRVLEG